MRSFALREASNNLIPHSGAWINALLKCERSMRKLPVGYTAGEELVEKRGFLGETVENDQGVDFVQLS